MNEDRVTTIEASKILNLCPKTVAAAGKTLGWDCIMDGTAFNAKKLWLRSEVEALAADRRENETPIRFQYISKANETRKLVEWADSLKRWPSKKAIEARTSDRHRFKDVEGVLETRVFRLGHDKWLRMPYLRVMDHRGERYL